MRFAMALAASLLFAVSTLAAECPDQTQAGMNECAANDYKKADAALNRVYKTIMDRLKDEGPLKAKLVDAQKKWVAFRDAQCAFNAAGEEGGSIYPMIASGCLEAVTATRIKELQAYLKCEEGVLGCPVPAK